MGTRSHLQHYTAVYIEIICDFLDSFDVGGWQVWDITLQCVLSAHWLEMCLKQE